jgi:hypothetical protein
MRDLIRSHALHFRNKDLMIKQLQKVITFYCLNEHVKYQQGMHEVIFYVLIF